MIGRQHVTRQPTIFEYDLDYTPPPEPPSIYYPRPRDGENHRKTVAVILDRVEERESKTNIDTFYFQFRFLLDEGGELYYFYGMLHGDRPGATWLRNQYVLAFEPDPPVRGSLSLDDLQEWIGRSVNLHLKYDTSFGRWLVHGVEAVHNNNEVVYDDHVNDHHEGEDHDRAT